MVEAITTDDRLRRRQCDRLNVCEWEVGMSTWLPRVMTLADERGNKRIVWAPTGEPIRRNPPIPPPLREPDQPTPEQLAAAAAMQWWLPTPKVTQPMRRSIPPRRRPKPSEEGVPTGVELAERRQRLGISQRDVAAIAQSSRGFVAEIERERRRSVAGRLRLVNALNHAEKMLT